MKTLSVRNARLARGMILALSIGSLVAVFQPVSHLMFQIGVFTAFLSAILFNMMPFLNADQSMKSLRQPALTILIVFLCLVGFAILSAWGYVLYLQAK
jgi:quinol-cytochrome oxidoreductase complex cytochrome b subunit